LFFHWLPRAPSFPCFPSIFLRMRLALVRAQNEKFLSCGAAKFLLQIANDEDALFQDRERSSSKALFTMWSDLINPSCLFCPRHHFHPPPPPPPPPPIESGRETRVLRVGLRKSCRHDAFHLHQGDAPKWKHELLTPFSLSNRRKNSYNA
jgi:hypothetical protein